MILRVRQGIAEDGFAVLVTELRAWFGVLRRTFCCKPAEAQPKVDPRLAEPIGAD